jgi:hypothetical protein
MSQRIWVRFVLIAALCRDVRNSLSTISIASLFTRCYVSRTVAPRGDAGERVSNDSNCLLLALGSVALAAQQADPRESKLLVLDLTPRGFSYFKSRGANNQGKSGARIGSTYPGDYISAKGVRSRVPLMGV